MTYHSEPKAGLWCYCQDEERWDYPSGFYDTREEAVEDGRSDFGGESFYVGRVSMMDEEEVADGFLRDVDAADEHIGVQDRWIWHEEQVLDVSTEQFQELRELVLDWVRKHNLTPTSFWGVESIEQIDLAPAADETGGGK